MRRRGICFGLGFCREISGSIKGERNENGEGGGEAPPRERNSDRLVLKGKGEAGGV